MKIHLNRHDIEEHLITKDRSTNYISGAKIKRNKKKGNDIFKKPQYLYLNI